MSARRRNGRCPSEVSYLASLDVLGQPMRGTTREARNPRSGRRPFFAVEHSNAGTAYRTEHCPIGATLGVSPSGADRHANDDSEDSATTASATAIPGGADVMIRVAYRGLGDT